MKNIYTIASLIIFISTLIGCDQDTNDKNSPDKNLEVPSKLGSYSIDGRWYHCWEEEQASELPDGLHNRQPSSGPEESAKESNGYSRVAEGGFRLTRFYVQKIMIFTRHTNDLKIYKKTHIGTCPENLPLDFEQSKDFKVSNLKFNFVSKGWAAEWGTVPKPALNAFSGDAEHADEKDIPEGLPVNVAVTELSTFYLSEPKYKGVLLLYADERSTPVKLYVGGSNYNNFIWTAPYIKF
ncbi:MAG: hypothetical protein OEZ15_11530 [Gammaproteobacteria bacterium]|nr:hypothetical protein [Gammaproteobacteria bacterium]